MRPDLRSIILSKTLSSFSTHFLSPRAVFSTEADDTIFRPDFTAIWGHPRKSVQINGGPGGSDKTSDLVAQTVKRLPAMWETWVKSHVSKIPWKRLWQPTPLFLPGKFHGERSLAGFSSWDHKESDTTERVTHRQSISLPVELNWLISKSEYLID